MERIEVLEDTENRYPWDTIAFTYDVIGDVEVLKYTGRIFDDGLQKTEGFTIGSIDYGFNLLTGERVIPFFPDAVVRFVDFRDGIAGAPSVKPWAGVIQQTVLPGDSVLTQNGVVTNPAGPKVETTFTTFDDGFLDIRYWSDDVLRHVYLFDGNVGRTNWNREHKTFDESGNLIRKTTLFDNGILQDDLFTDGVLNTRRQSDGEFGVGNIKPWSEVTETYTVVGTESVLVSTRTTFDSGLIRTDGVRLEDRLVSPSQEFFSDDPPPPELVQDVIRYRTWEDGDAHGGVDTKPWIRIEETTFRPGDSLLTEDGVIANSDSGSEVTERTITYDSGDETLLHFTDGDLEYKLTFDGPVVESSEPPGVGQGHKSWYLIADVFDAAGDIKSKITYFDNGIRQDDQFVNGVLTSRAVLDNFISLDDGIKPWSGIITNFDLSGVITDKNTFYDDGQRFIELYTDGLLSQTIYTAPPAGPSQCTFGSDPNSDCPETPLTVTRRVTDFDGSGERTQEVSTFSDRDVTGFVFTDGQITERQYYDGDDDEDWVVARILFESGQRTEVFTYDSLDLVPDDGTIILDIGSGEFPAQETFT